MLKLSLSAAVSAAILAVGMSSTAQAVPSADGHGVGDVLLFPYYTVENNYNTLVHLVNHDSQRTVMAKVRFREHKNSQDALDFTVILSPNDVFTGYVKVDANGSLVFDKTDNTCTAPQGQDANGNAAAQGNIQFVAQPGDVADVNLPGIGDPKTGHIEVITMGSILNANVSDDVLGQIEAVIEALELAVSVFPGSNRNRNQLMLSIGLDPTDQDDLESPAGVYITEVINSLGVGGQPASDLLTAFQDRLSLLMVANEVAFGALHDIDREPNNCFTLNANGTNATGAAAYFAPNKIADLQAAIVPSVAGTHDLANGDGESAITNALSGHFAIIDFNGGVAGSSRPLVIRNAATNLVTNAATGGAINISNPCGGSEANLICGQFTAHYPVPNLANLNGVNVLTGGVANNVRQFRQLERRVNRSEAADNRQPLTISNEYTQKLDGTTKVTMSEINVTLPFKHIYLDTTVVGVNGLTGGAQDVTSAVAFAGADTAGAILPRDDWNDVDTALRGPLGQVYSPGFAPRSEGGCVTSVISYWDREEQEPVGPYVPPTASGPVRPGNDAGTTDICHESAMFTFNDGVTNPGQAAIAAGDDFEVTIDGVDIRPDHGWLKITPRTEFNGALNQVNAGGNQYYPIANTGFAFWKRNFGSPANNYAQIMDNTRD